MVNELEAAGWVARDDELRYRIGASLPRAVDTSMPREAQQLLARIAAEAQAGVTVSCISAKALTVVAKAQAGRRAVTGHFRPGRRSCRGEPPRNASNGSVRQQD
ncbi:Putative transcriptional regulator, IclR family [Mycobacteroides abscessus subsp. abscessus]|nr:Putative transcriptional regulator, IclR family [Mycobacteroides abscessus subsp. abscessus]